MKRLFTTAALAVVLAAPATGQTVEPDDDPAWLGWAPAVVVGTAVGVLAATGNFDTYVDQPFDAVERAVCGSCGNSRPLSWAWHGLISLSLSGGAAGIT